MKTLIVTAEIINDLFPYQGQTKQLTIGETLFVVCEKVACVRYRQGYANTFTILTDGKHYSGQDLPVNTEMGYYNANRWSLNDRFKKLIK